MSKKMMSNNIFLQLLLEKNKNFREGLFEVL